MNSGSDRQKDEFEDEIDPDTGEAEDSGNGNQENGNHKSRRTLVGTTNLALVAKQMVKGSAFRSASEDGICCDSGYGNKACSGSIHTACGWEIPVR